MARDLHAEMRQVNNMLASPKRSALLSGSLHAGAIVLVLLVTSTKTPPITSLDIPSVARDIGRYITLVPRRSEGGGGGGMRDPGPARKGGLPRAARRQFVPPDVRFINFDPRLRMEPTIIASPDVVMPVMHFGDPNGVLGSPWAGRGLHGGIGEGEDGGVGPGKGPGAGDGEAGVGITGQTRWQSTVIAPVLLSKIEPEYTEEARRAKLQGMVMLRIEVNERGQAQNISVRQSLGLGLDERAVDAVKRWKFRSGSIDGKPAVTVALIEVNFRLL